MSVTEHSIRTLRMMRNNGGRFSIMTRDNRIIDSHPKGIKQNAIRALRKHMYVKRINCDIPSTTFTFELTRKAYDLLDEIEWTPTPLRNNHGAY